MRLVCFYIIPCNEGMTLDCDKNDGYFDLGSNPRGW